MKLPQKLLLLLALLGAVATIPTPPASALQAVATESERAEYGVLANLNLTAAAAATYNSPAQTGYGSNLSCVYAQTASTGAPSTTIAVQGEVPGTANWATFITSSAVTTGVATVTVTMGTAILTGTNQLNAVVPAPWRVSLVTAGGTVTGAVSCTGQD